jgi:hypothetical protein
MARTAKQSRLVPNDLAPLGSRTAAEASGARGRVVSRAGLAYLRRA